MLVLLDPVAGVEVLPEPRPEPLLAAPGVVGVLLAPEAAPLRWSRRQSSRSAPVMPAHLVTSLPDAPVAALPDVLVSDEPVLEDEEPVDGAVVLPAEPAPVAPEGELPMLPDDAPVPVLEPAEPEDCAIAAPDKASNAAAVAAVRVFNIMREISFEGWINTAARLGMQMPYLASDE